MGLGAMKEAWQRQTKDFAHDHPETYSCLVLDNRGIGESDKPLMRYSTSEMARDILEVCEDIGWLHSPATSADDRSLHVFGISMGGMIAQELALLRPKSIASLTIVSSAPRIVNTVGWLENLRNRINLFLPKSLEDQIVQTAGNMYTAAWLSAPDSTEAVVQTFPTNGDRFAAGEVWKRTHPERFDRKGFLCQILAAGWHHKSAEQLRMLGDEVGRDRICLVHGTEDQMLKFHHGEMLLEELGGEASGVTKHWFQGLGHVIPIERRREFFDIVKAMVNKS